MSVAKIRIHFQNGSAEERALPVGVHVIGRDAGAIVLNDANVSMRHAEIIVNPASVSIRDVGSTNGTYDMNGHRLGPVALPLSANQWVRMGESSIVVLEVPRPTAPGTQLMPQQPGPGWAPPGFAAPGAPVGTAPQPIAPPTTPYPHGQTPIVPGAMTGSQAIAPPTTPYPQGPGTFSAPTGLSPAHAAPVAVVAAAAAFAPGGPPGAPQFSPPVPPTAPAGFSPPNFGGPPPHFGGPPGAVPPPPVGFSPPGSAPLAGLAPPPAVNAGGYVLPSPAHLPPPSGASSAYSHPDEQIRHTYPVLQETYGLGAAFGLLMKTAPFIVARLGVLVAVSAVAFVYWIIVIAGFILLGRKAPIVGWAWLIVTLGVAGWFWRTVVRYFLYLLKAAHIAVLTEVITTGQIGNGQEGMFAYGKRIVTQRFGEVNVLFGVDMLVDGIVRAFNRTLDWVSNLLPIPGLQSVVGVVQAVLRAATTYVDETIFSYNLARGDANVFRSSKDGLIYYAQNSKEFLKTGVYVVILEKVFSFVLFWIVFLPVLAVVYTLPSSFGAFIPVTAIIGGLLFAADVQQAFLRPLFLTMVLVRFHTLVRNQPIDLEWDGRLDRATTKFKELKDKAATWIGDSGPRPVGSATPAE